MSTPKEGVDSPDLIHNIALLAAARKEINNAVKTGLSEAVSRQALPAAKVAAPSIADQYLVAKATTSRVYITTQGPVVYDRIIGWQEYGGTVEAPILPKNGTAIRIGGDFVSQVSTPRHKSGDHKIEKALAGRVQGMEQIARDEIEKAFEAFIVH